MSPELKSLFFWYLLFSDILFQSLSKRLLLRLIDIANKKNRALGRKKNQQKFIEHLKALCIFVLFDTDQKERRRKKKNRNNTASGITCCFNYVYYRNENLRQLPVHKALDSKLNGIGAAIATKAITRHI